MESAVSKISSPDNELKRNVFTFDPQDYVADYVKNGYVLVKNGVDPDFLEVAKAQAAMQEENHKDMESWHFKGKKRQYLYDFEEWDFYGQGYETLALTAGLPPEKLKLCERHIKVYESEAKSHVPPHKDRVAAELTVGLPLVIPEGSHVVLWPENVTDVNPLNSTALYRLSLDEKDLPENILDGIEPVRLYADPGDVLLFRGNSLYHEREKPADTSVLYLKFNAMDLDPIGEDPSTVLQQETSQKLLSENDDQALLDLVVRVSPKLERISRHYTRLYWKEVIQVYVGGEEEFTISELELQAFKKAEGGKTVREVIVSLGISRSELLEHVPMIRRLASLKGLDITT
ncbi:MAG: hypothetical protein AB8D52_00520 [Gammaproteobacteria bacterium]